MAVLAIQSHVAYGRVGNAVAVFALERLGIDVWPVPTTLLGCHPGLGAPHGVRLTAKAVEAQIEGLAGAGALAGCQAVLSGYLGLAATAGVVARAVARAKAVRPDALYLCDPVIGDAETGAYVAEDVIRAIRRTLVPVADVMVPNAFELATLAGLPVGSIAEARVAARKLSRGGPAVVVATGVPDGPDGIAALAATAAGAHAVRTPRLRFAHRPDGAGDLFAALLLGHRLNERDWPQALSLAASATFAVLAHAAATGARILPTVAAQSELAAPARVFAAERIG